ncbi:MAG TPA: 30S ribosomal protein S30 [Acetobacteraceae bacterium]|jgi:ribosomal subunit interface protein|nr:30S ribosomal protein S30 [Acetobacteraceae bacterium]
MQEPLRISFRNLDSSPVIEDEIRKRVADLERFFDRITACSVVVEVHNRHQRQGNLYHIRIDLIVPGREIVVRREPPEHQANEDLHVAIHNAFDSARRQLQDYARVMRADVKTHEAPSTGRIVRLIAEKDYGFLVTDSGDEVYVHRNAVPGGGFDKLRVGDRVRYVVQEEEGEHGPQASTVIRL